MMSEVQLSNRFFMQQGLSNICLTIFDGQQFTIVENPTIIQNPGKMAPRIDILEQPTKSFRFRYTSETGSHGSLMGENSTKKNRCYPKLRIRDCVGKVKIRAVLYYFDEANGNYIQHVHKLDGKNCDAGIYETEHTITREAQIVEFSNVHIKHVAKRNVRNTLVQRFMAESGDESDANNRAKSMSKILEQNINEVKIGFHAEIFVENVGSYVQLCPSVYSHKITNRKTSNASDLRICRISKCSGDVAGGEEVFILCDKIDKKNIGVRFFQLDENNEEKWAAFGDFNESHVHHQVAIVFKTPPYEDQLIETEVQVLVQLCRPKDDGEGEPLTYTYIPSEDGNRRKKAKMLQCASPQSNLQDRKLHGQRETLVGRRRGASNLTLDAKGGNDRGACGADASCTVTSSSTYAPATAEVIEGLVQFPYQPVGKLSEIPEIEEDLKQSSQPFLNPNSDDLIQSALKTADLDFKENNPTTGSVLKDVADPSMYGSIATDFGENMFPDEDYQQSQMVGTNDPFLSQSFMQPDDDLAELLRSVSNFDYDKLVPRGVIDVEDNFEDDVEADGSTEIDSRRSEIETKIKIAGRRDQRLMYRLAVRVANSLLDYARSEDVKSILKPMVDLIAFSDANGDNAIHLAVIHAKLGALKVLLETMFWCTEISRHEIMNALNDLGQTPLHIAVCNGDVEFVKLLLSYGVDLNKRDKRGNNSVHLAVQNHPDNPAILMELVKKQDSSLDVMNNDGFAPLHLAVMEDSLETIAVLLDADAAIDCQDGTAGRTPLHIAVQNVNVPLVRFLLDEKADPDMKMFNGRSPLHLAVLIQSEEMVSLLMLSYADPYLQSDELSTSLDSSDDDLNVDETPGDNSDSNGLNCFDLAKNNKRILSILHGNQSSTSVDSIAPCDSGYKSEPCYDSGLSLPKYEEVLEEKRLPEQHDQDSGMGLCADDDSEFGYPMGQRENIDSGLSLSKSEMTLVDTGTTISLSKLFDPPGEKDWTILTTCVGRSDLIDKLGKSASPTASLLTHIKNLEDLEFGLEAVGSTDGLEIIHRYKSNKDNCAKRSNLEKMMGKLKINH